MLDRALFSVNGTCCPCSVGLNLLVKFEVNGWDHSPEVREVNAERYLSYPQHVSTEPRQPGEALPTQGML